MEKIRSKAGLLGIYKNAPTEVREYFEHLPRLLDLFPFDVALAYVFSRVEQAQNMALYCGLAKLHRADSDLAYRAVQIHHITRVEFRTKFKTIYGAPIPKETSSLITQAEAVRDLVMHGKGASDDHKRNAIARVLAYATAFNELAVKHGGPKPFGDLRGFKGSGQGLAKPTTRWVLRGMGFGV